LHLLQTLQSIHNLLPRGTVTFPTVKDSGQIAFGIAAFSGQLLARDLGNVHPPHHISDPTIEQNYTSFANFFYLTVEKI